MQKQQQRTVARPTVVVAVAAGCGLVVAAVMVVIPNHHCPPSVGAVAPAHSLPRVREAEWSLLPVKPEWVKYLHCCAPKHALRDFPEESNHLEDTRRHNYRCYYSRWS